MTKGPIYGVELIDTLPLGETGLKQQMPSRADLERSRRNGDRVAAGYEVLLDSYRDAMKLLRQFNPEWCSCAGVSNWCEQAEVFCARFVDVP